MARCIKCNKEANELIMFFGPTWTPYCNECLSLLNRNPGGIPNYDMNCIVKEHGLTCNRMCLLSEWDENKPRDCSVCRGNYSLKLDQLDGNSRKSEGESDIESKRDELHKRPE